MLDKKEIKQASSRCSFSPNTTVCFFFNVAIPDVVSHRGQVWTPLLPPDVFLWFHRSVHQTLRVIQESQTHIENKERNWNHSKVQRKDSQKSIGNVSFLRCIKA